MDLEGLNAHTKVQTVWHNGAQHRLVTSAYNPGVRSALVVQLRPPKVLGAGAAAGGGEERAELEKQIQGSEQARAWFRFRIRSSWVLAVHRKEERAELEAQIQASEHGRAWFQV